MTSPGGVLDQSPMTGRGRTALIIAFVLVAVLLAIAARRPAGEGVPLDPDGTGQSGVKALVLLLREGGADVRVSARTPDASRQTAVVLRDTFDRERRDAIHAWVRAGGTLVVADPRSPLGLAKPFFSPVNGAGGESTVDGPCGAIPALAGIRRVETGGSLVYDRDVRGPGAVGCFGTDDGDFLVATPLGSGTVVALGGAGLWINVNLAEQSNAGLAVALLAPRKGTAMQLVTDLADDASLIGAERPEGRSILDVLPSGAKVAGIELAIAFVVAALWRARRLGRPVDEVQPVVVPGSDLVAAVGNARQVGRHRGHAAGVLSDRSRRRVADRLGLPRALPPEQLAAIVAARTEMSTADALAGLAPADPADDAALLRIAQAGASVERAVEGTTEQGDHT
jgi:hypothetical protein